MGEIIMLETNDLRVGQMVGGAITVWPPRDIHNQPYSQVDATILRVNETRFVVIGPDRGQHIEKVVLTPFPIPPAPVMEPEPEVIPPPVSSDRIAEITAAFQKVVKDAKSEE